LKDLLADPPFARPFVLTFFIATKPGKRLDKGSTDFLKPFGQLNQNH